ncbi:MAG: hypothetical protein NW200_14795 [Hyphomonadaceae bacterium]|nr:hypothetical protein [Hyphomonadaceae bacterium]
MADVSLVCVREDAWKADLLSEALERYGFTVCRSASVFEDFQGYAAVIVLFSPGAARSDLVMQTASRAMDWGKLIPVFVNLCRLPDCLSGVALHDLSAWDGRGEDAVVKAIAYHAQRLSGAAGKPVLAPPVVRAPAPPLALEPYAHAPQAWIEPPHATPNYGYEAPYAPSPYGDDHRYAAQGYQAPYDAPAPAPVHEQPYQHAFSPTPSEPAWRTPQFARDRQQTGYTPPPPYFVATAHNEMEHYAPPPAAGARALGAHVAVSPNEDAAQRRAYFMQRAAFDHTHQPDEPVTPPRQRRPLSGLFTVVISALALLGTAWVEEARTREVQILRATPAEATAILTTPTAIDASAAAYRQRPAESR